MSKPRLDRCVLVRPLIRSKRPARARDACVVAFNNEEFVIKAELPGVNKDDVKVAIEDGIVRIQGERKQEKEEKNKKFHRVERSYGSFLRTFSLPNNIDEAKIQAEHKDGVLTLAQRDARTSSRSEK